MALLGELGRLASGASEDGEGAAELDSAFERTRALGEALEQLGNRAAAAEELYLQLQDAFEQASEAEALRKSEKLKSALLDAVSHDLRTPLTSIKASVTTLLDSEGGHRTIELKGDERIEFLDIINEETDRLNRFIENMVELARVEAGSLNSPGRPASVDEMISIALTRASIVAQYAQVSARHARNGQSAHRGERTQHR